MNKFLSNEVVIFQGREVIIIQADHGSKFGKVYTIRDRDTIRFFVSEFDLAKKESK